LFFFQRVVGCFGFPTQHAWQSMQLMVEDSDQSAQHTRTNIWTMLGTSAPSAVCWHIYAPRIYVVCWVRSVV